MARSSAFTWWIASAALVGIALGVGAFTFGYAKGYSYLLDDPNACVNCHVMRPQFDGWLKSSHRAAATCNDCHTPAGLSPKYFAKARHGINHSVKFTTGWFPDVIRITRSSREETEQACLKCHAAITENIRAIGHTGETSCIRCHRNVGHLHE